MTTTTSRLLTICSLLIILFNNNNNNSCSALTLSSSGFTEGGTIPTTYTEEGENIAPPLSWSDVPNDTKSFVIIVDDPDAPDPNAPKMTWVHWVLYNIPPETTILTDNAHLPSGTKEGINDYKTVGYRGPNPPIGTHRYYFKIYALDTVLNGLYHPDKAKVEGAMEGHVLGQATLIGTFAKSGASG